MTDRFDDIIAEVLEIEREEAERQGDECDSIPRPGASDERIAAAEQARERTFSAGYRAFLRTCDGWDHFAWGISLFGTDELAGDAYDDAVETLGYTDDVPAELERALIIGRNENDATLIMLLDSGEVVDHLYEETQRHASLAEYVRSRKATLLEMRASAQQQRGVVEREWTPEFRRRDDEALTRALRDELAKPRAPLAVRTLTAAPAAATPTPAPHELVSYGDARLVAALELGLVLYLGACPTRDEVLATVRAVRAAFPLPGPMKWALADRMTFGTNTCDDPDALPFADALRVDDSGYYGVRISGGAPDEYVINIRGIPPEDAMAGPDDRRASFVEVLVPVTASPRALEQLAHALADLLPIRSGHGGYFARARGSNDDGWDAIFRWCRRFFQVEPAYVDGWLAAALDRVRGASWLTLVGTPFLDALPPPAFGAAIARRDGRHAAVFTAGELGLGDIAHGAFPAEVAEVARWIDPVGITRFAKHGELSMGGVWFSTSTTELPGAFNHHHATQAFLRRFVDPDAFVGASPREQALAMIDRLKAAMNDTARAAWKRDELVYFRDVLRTLVSGAYHAGAGPLATEALELAARYPGWTPASTYNNLLLAYLREKRIADALALMPVALQTARDENNPHTYHNAACVLVEAGKLDEAFDCVRRAAEAKYEHMNKLRDDSDLAPLHARADWQALFASL